jgi:membrane-bound metal-dependent hydrolase YbcI (DUF457 family)
MEGRQYVAIGVVSALAGLQYAQTIGLETEPETVVVSILVVSLGSLFPDIDHPRSTISRTIPGVLFGIGLAILLFPVVSAMIPAAFEDFRSASNIFQFLHQLPLTRLGLLLVILAVAIKVTSAIISACFGHQGAIHSLVFAAGATILAIVVCVRSDVAWWYGLPFGWGWLSHLLADAITEMGLPSLFWPFQFDFL